MRLLEKTMLFVPLILLVGMGVQLQGTRLNKTEHSNLASYEPDVDYNAEVQQNGVTYADYDDHGTEAELTTGANGEYSAYKPKIVEMLIVVSEEFAKNFNADMSAMTAYFNAMFLDVDHRFKTLAMTNISFHVTSIQLLQDKDVVEDARTGEGTVDMEKVLDNFAKWVYTRKENFPNFDLAMLVIFPEIDCCGRLGFAYVQGICSLGDAENGKVGSSFVVAPRGDQHPAETVAHEIAHVLGAHHDNQTGRVASERFCTKNYIMNPDTATEDTLSFSWCSDEDIATFLQSQHAKCLLRLDSDAAPIIDTSSSGMAQDGMMIPPGVSMTIQCQILDGSAIKPPYENQCGYIDACVKPNDYGNRTTGLNLQPLDGTPCGANERCFRGNCLSVGVHLMSVSNGQCLKVGDRFTSDESPIMGNCSSLVTPLSDMFIIWERGMFGIELMTPYIPPRRRDVGLKCLTLKFRESPYLSFEDCFHGNASPWFGWNITKVENDEFQLHHCLVRDICLRVSSDNDEFIASTNCSITDEATRFRFRSENGTTIINDASLAMIGNVKDEEASRSQQESTFEFWEYVVTVLIGCTLGCILVGVIIGLWKIIQIRQRVLKVKSVVISSF